MGLKLDENSALAPPKYAKQVPGPGGYDPNYRTATRVDPAFSMRPRLTMSLAAKKQVPGPGTYGVNLNDKAAAPKYRFGSGAQR